MAEKYQEYPRAVEPQRSDTLLEAQVRGWQRLSADWQNSETAKGYLVKVRDEQTAAQARISLTMISNTEAQIRAGLVADSLAKIAPLTEHVNNTAAAVDQRLTNASYAEKITHLLNRHQSLEVFAQLLSEGKITPAEEEALRTSACMNAQEDIDRTEQRMQTAKAAVASLSAMAMSGISASEKKLREI
jgi:hypothetical protein